MTPAEAADRASAPGSRATASRRSSTPPSRCSPRSATTGSPWTPSRTRAKASKATLYRRWNGKATPGHRRAAARQGGARRSPTPATCASDLVATFCGMGGLTDHDTIATFASVITAIAPRPGVRRGVPRPASSAPRSHVSRTVFERARDRGEIRDGPRPRPARPGARRDRAAPHLRARASRPTRTLIARVIDQIILPAARHRPDLRTDQHPDPHEGTPMTDTDRTPSSAERRPGDGHAAPRLGAGAHLDRPADGGARRHHRQHRPALHRARPRHRPGRT